MGRKDRFGDLQRALNLLRSATSNDNEGEAPDAPPGTRLRFYQDWKKGGRTVTYNRQSSSNPIKLEERVIELFGAGATNNKASVPISKRSLDGIANTGLDTTDVGYAASGANYAGQVIPAKITVYTGGARQATAQRSKLTGVPYKPRAQSKSYTLPFGQTGTTSYKEKALALITKAKAREGVVGASCRAEDLILG